MLRALIIVAAILLLSAAACVTPAANSSPALTSTLADQAGPAVTPNWGPMISLDGTPAPDAVGIQARPAGPPRTAVTYQGREFAPTAGPIRAELLPVDRLEPTGLVLTDAYELREGSDGPQVFTLPSLAISQGFLVRSVNTPYGPRGGAGGSNVAYPQYEPGAGAFVFTAPGTPPVPPPYGRVTPGPGSPGAPTPTPVPTPTSPIVAMPLSAEGLLQAGWPRVNLERAQLEYEGVTYGYTSFRYVNDSGADSAIPTSALQELEVLAISYPVNVGPVPSKALVPFVSAATATDHVRIYRFKDRPDSEAIVVDQSPQDLRADQYSFYEPSPAPAPTPTRPNTRLPGSVPTPTPLPPTPTPGGPPTPTPTAAPMATPAPPRPGQPDDVLATPGGYMYLANIQQTGVTNPWPPIVVEHANIGDVARVSYRARIDSNPGESHNNIVPVNSTGQDLGPIRIEVANVPEGIGIQSVQQWAGPRMPFGDFGVVLAIAIGSDVVPGQYAFNIDVTVGKDAYTRLTCTVAVAAAGPRPTPTPTPTPRMSSIDSPDAIVAAYEQWPADYRFAIGKDVVALLSYPSDIIDWWGFATIHHI